MKAYLWFSLKRRWLSKSALIILALSFFVIIALVTVDFWLSSHEVVTIQWPSHLFEYLEDYDSFLFTEQDSMIHVEYIEPSTYIIHPHQTNVSNQTLVALVKYAHQRYILDTFKEEDQMKIVMMLEPTIQYNQSSSSIGSIMIISFLYFSLLGFSSNMSSDILSEKHSQALLMLLNSMTRKEYFKMKIIQNIINIFAQFALILLGVVSALWIRQGIDQGRGLLSFLYEQGWVNMRFDSFYSILNIILASYQGSISIVLGFISFFIGLFTCMLLLVWISFKAQKSEDLVMIQTPFYITVVLMYYVSLWIGEFAAISQSISPWLTLTPIMSMIFHPFQLSVKEVPLWLSILSIFIAFGVMISVKVHAEKAFIKEIV